MRHLSDVALRRWGLVMFGVTVACSVATLMLSDGIAGRPGLAHDYHADLGYIVNGVGFMVTGLLLTWARPRNAVGWLLAAAALAGELCNAGQAYGTRALVVPEDHLPLGTTALSLSAPLWFVGLLIPATLLLVRYPSGRIDEKWPRRLDRFVIVAMVVLYVGYAGSSNSVTDEVVGRQPPVLLPHVLGGVLLFGGVLLGLAGAVGVAVTTVVRLLRSGYPERQQLAWLLTTAVVAIAVVMFVPYPYVGSVAYSSIPVAVAIGVLRYRLLGIEVVVRRTLVYGALTGLVLVVFVVVTAALTALLPRGPAPTVVAASVVAVGLAPAREWLQRLVDRLVYGDRSDPWSALARLATPLGGTDDEDLLPSIAAAVGQALRVPGVAVRASDGATVAVWGDVPDSAVAVPLRTGGRDIGVLAVAPRRGEAAPTRADARVLAALAPLVAVTLHAVSLAADVRRERQRVLDATQAERRRLRQELHDGLGPSLSGVALGLEAAESRLDATHDTTRQIVARTRSEVAGAIEEIRRIIDDLRPTALDEQDLAAALRRRVAHLTLSGRMRVDLLVPEQIPTLSREVESAAYRIAEEALNNVVRHSRASTCTVRLSVDDALHLEVRDDGIGLRSSRRGGVGLGSMRERAERLGGTFEARHGEGGTAVVARIPLQQAEALA